MKVFSSNLIYHHDEKSKQKRYEEYSFEWQASSLVF